MENLQAEGVGKKCALGGALMAVGVVAGAILANPWAVVTSYVGGGYFYLSQCMDQQV